MSSILLVLFLLEATLAADSSDIQWISPSTGSTFHAGDTIIAKWTSSANTPATSPSFRICQDLNGSGNCGQAMWPSVQSSGDAYIVSLSVPDEVDENAGYYLQMEDDFGAQTTSGSFKIDASTSDPQQRDSQQAPFSLPVSSSASPSAATTPAPSLPPPPQLPSNASNSPPPTLALAIPLSIFGAILLLAVFLLFRHRRSMKRERKADQEKLGALGALGEKMSLGMGSQRSSYSFHRPQSGYGDGYAVEKGDVDEWMRPVPLWMPPQHHLHQGSGPNRLPYSTHSYGHGHGNGYPNQRQPMYGEAPTISPPAFAYPYADPTPANPYTTPLPTPPVAPMAAPQPPQQSQTQYPAYTQSQAPPQIQLEIPSSRLSPSPSLIRSKLLSGRNSRGLSRKSTSSRSTSAAGPTPTRYSSTRTVVAPARNNSAVARWTRKTADAETNGKDGEGDDDASATESVLGEYMMFDDVDLDLDLDLGCIPEIPEEEGDEAPPVPEKDCIGRRGGTGGIPASLVPSRGRGSYVVQR